jgi:UPF0755 protein
MRKHLIISISILIILFFLVIIIFFVWRGIYLPKNPSGKEKIFKIEEGEGLKEISFHLEEEGLIKSRLFFEIYVLSKGVSRNLQAGDYLLSSSMAIPEITKKIVSGDVIKEKITILEGWSLKDIADYVENNNLGSKEELFQITGYPENQSGSKDYSDIFPFLKDKPIDTNLEGYIFPDTYEIQRNEKTLETIIIKALKNFDKKLNSDLRQEIKSQNKTVFDILIMASLLEKEIKTFEDKKIVSGILWKRREHGWPLQVDATLTYLTGKKSSEFTKEDLESPSPYNTYKYSWIPGPICNPGLDSILAAIYPEKSDYWYYLSTPDGKTIFSKTLEEHNLAKAKYLR